MFGQSSTSKQRPLALIIEGDSLTRWSLSSYLTSTFEVQPASTLEEAYAHLRRPELRVIICGSPIVDEYPGILEELTEDPQRIVIALVSDTTCVVPDGVAIVEKPFALEQLAKLLSRRSAGSGI